MRTTKYFLTAMMTMGLVASLGVFRAAEEAKPKYDIGEIMEKAHKGKPSLLKQVTSGKASAEQKKELLALYEELAKNKPEKGTEADWKRRTSALVKATKDVVEGKGGSTAALGKAANCKACHTEHKGD
jgi:hypothetical protein